VSLGKILLVATLCMVGAQAIVWLRIVLAVAMSDLHLAPSLADIKYKSSERTPAYTTIRRDASRWGDWVYFNRSWVQRRTSGMLTARRRRLTVVPKFVAGISCEVEELGALPKENVAATYESKLSD